MRTIFKTELIQHGLSLNMEKCLVQTNSATAHIAPINVEGQSIPMVTATEGFKVLGTQFTLLGSAGGGGVYSRHLRADSAAAKRVRGAPLPMRMRGEL